MPNNNRQCIRIKKQMLIQFMNHCAIIIQCRFKGFIQRKNYKRFLPIYRRFKQLLISIYNGWKTRKILKLTLIKNKINQIKSYNNKQKYHQERIAKRDLLHDINRLNKNAIWIEYYKKQKKIPLNNSKIITNNNQNIMYSQIQKKPNLKSALNIIPKQYVTSNIKNSKSNYNNSKIKQTKNIIKNQNYINRQHTKQRQQQINQYQQLKVIHLPPKPKQTKRIISNQNKTIKSKSKQIRQINKKTKPSLNIQIQNNQKQVDQILQTPCAHINLSNLTKIQHQTIQKLNKLNQSHIQIEQQKLSIKYSIKDLNCSLKLRNNKESHRKSGLKMTISKRFQKIDSFYQNPIKQINSTVLNQLTKKKQIQNILNINNNKTAYQNSQHKIVSDFNLSIQSNGVQSLKNTLRVKLSDFDKKKQQHQQKFQKFKKIILK